MDYTGILRHALEMAWRHRWLWLLALLAGEGSTGASFNFPSRPYSFSSTRRGQATGNPPDVAPFVSWIGDHLGLILAAALVAILVAIALLLISVIAQGAVVRGAAALDAGTDTGLGASWRAGAAVFWPMLGLRLLLVLIAAVLLLVLGGLVGGAVLAGVAGHSPGLVALLGWQAAGLLLLLIPFAVALGTVTRLAVRYVALDGAGPATSLRLGTRMLFRRFGKVVALWGIELACSLGAGLAAALLAVLLFGPLLLGGVVVYGAHAPAALVVVAAWALVAGALLLVVAAAIAAFFSCYWTIAFRRLVALG